MEAKIQFIKGLDEKVLDAVNKYYKLSDTIDGGYVYPGLKGTDWYKSRLEVYRFIG
jgi:hypothetical protein